MSALFSPIRLGPIELPNRITVSPMCQYSAEDGLPNDWHLMHYGMLAASGASLLVTEATAVDLDGRITHGDTAIHTDAATEAWARIVAHCRRYGSARLGMQLAHAGRKASSQRPWEGGHALGPSENPWQTVAPSAVPFGDTWHTPREMTEGDIETLEERFAAAARRAVQAGFEVLEIHAAHGYLLHEFLSPIANRRTDRWGGDLEGRSRLLLSIARRIAGTVPAGVAWGVRLSGSDWTDGGFGPDEAAQVSAQLKDLGAAYVTVSSGGIAPGIRIASEPGYQVPFAEEVKRTSGVTTCAVGMIVSPRQAEEIVASGKADMVALARGFLDNPHWGWWAADVLGGEVARPPQYARSAPDLWPGSKLRD